MTTTAGKGEKTEETPKDPTRDPTAALRVIFALVFLGCTAYLFLSEVIHTILRMCGIT